MFGGRFFRANHFASRYLAGQSNASPQGGTFLLALHGTGGAGSISTPAFVLGGLKPRKTGRPREDDEALLMMFGML